MSFTQPRVRGRRLTQVSDISRPDRHPPLLASYENDMPMPHVVTGDCTPIYIHVDTLGQQIPNHHQRPLQPDLAQRRDSFHRSSSYHSQPHHQYQAQHNQLHRQQSNRFSPPRFYHQMHPQMSPPRPPQMPTITDPYTLNRAVQIDATAAFDQLQKVFHERSELKIQVNALQKEIDDVKKDYAGLMAGHRQMEAIWLQKQELMWKFVERIKLERAGEERLVKKKGDIAAGQWVHKEGEAEEENKVTKEDVEKEWSHHFRLGPPDEGVNIPFEGHPIEEEERGRSRVVKTVQIIENETASSVDTTTEPELGIEESAIEYPEADTKLDPNATPFEPSPTRNPTQEVKTQIVIINNTPTKLTGPLSFRDVVAGPPTVVLPTIVTMLPTSVTRVNDNGQSPDRKSRSPERPWTEVRHKKASSHLKPAFDDSRRSSSVATRTSKTEASTNSNSTKGGKKAKSKRGGTSSGSAASLRQEAPSSKKELRGVQSALGGNVKENERPQQASTPKASSARKKLDHVGHGHPPPPRKLHDSWRPGSSDSPRSGKSSEPQHQHSPRKHHRQRPSKKLSPEILRVTNLPLSPLPANNPFLTPQSRRSLSRRFSPTSVDALNDQQHFEMGPPLFARSELQESTGSKSTYMTPARLQATLQSVPAPYDQVCPDSLLSRLCEVKDCQLLHLCKRFVYDLAHSTPTEDCEDDFPALGTSVEDTSYSKICKKHYGTTVREGEVCSTGRIHLKPSCMAEVEGVPCHFWSSPPRQTHTKSISSSSISPVTISSTLTNKKFKQVKLDYDYTAPPVDYQRPSSSTSGSKSHDLLDDINSLFNRKTSSEHGKTSKQPTQAEIREAHFKTFVHERDGIGRDAWHARVQNAELRGVHQNGLWGVKQKQLSPPATLDWATEMEDEDDNQYTETEVSSLAGHDTVGFYGRDGTCDEREEITKLNDGRREDCWGAQRNPLKKYVSAEKHILTRRMSR